MTNRRELAKTVQQFVSFGANARHSAMIAGWEAEFTTCFATSRGKLVHAAGKYLHADPAAANDCVQAAATSIWIHRGRYALHGRPLLPLL